VLHSITKYINGHSDVLMGAVILPARHGSSGTGLIDTLRFLQNAIGAVPSAYDAWLAMRGAKTLHLRMQAHGLNALRVARYLESRPDLVDEVIYPGLESSPRHPLARDMLSPHARKWIAGLHLDSEEGGVPFGGMISFRVRGDGDTAERFLTRTHLFTLAESLGGVESLAELPARMTHGVSSLLLSPQKEVLICAVTI
jgi:cystathionine gamma-lyase